MKKFVTMCLAVILAVSGIFAQETKVIKVANADSPTVKVGDMDIYGPSYVVILAFKGAFEKYTNGRYRVDIYPRGVLGDAASNLEQVAAGVLDASTPADGALSPFWKNVQLLSIPYLFASPLVAYDLLDSEFGQMLFEECAKTSGLRIIATWDNGGYRNFTNSKKEIRTAADMQNIKMRTMDIPIHMEMVKALGASPTPVSFVELYSALQTGVVDGQENSGLITLIASLQEVQKYLTLDGHLLGLAFLVFNENWYRSLSVEDQEALLKAGREASIAGRGTARYAESLAVETMAKSGMQVYAPTEADVKTFRDAAQGPAIAWLKANVNDALTDEILATVNSGKLGNGKVDLSGISSTTAVTSGGSSGSAGTGSIIIAAVIALIAGLVIGLMANKAKAKKA